MTKHRGGHLVGEGFYWNPRVGGVVVREEETLPGDSGATFYRLPFIVMLALGTVLGGIYILLLPLVLNVAAIYVLGRRILGGLAHSVRSSVSFGWRPTEAYLGGRNRKNGKNGKNGKDSRTNG